MPVLFVRCLMIGSHVSVVDGADVVEVTLWSRGLGGVSGGGCGVGSPVVWDGVLCLRGVLGDESAASGLRTRARARACEQLFADERRTVNECSTGDGDTRCVAVDAAARLR